MPWKLRVLIVTTIATMLLVASSETRWAAGVTTARAAEAAVIQDQEAGPAPAVLLAFSGGAVEGKRARTQTTPTSLPSGVWTTLPGAALIWFVGALDSDLINVAFSAECNKSANTRLLIRVLDNGALVAPSDNGQTFCTSTLPATHKSNWVRRSSGGLSGLNHTFVVQFFNTGGIATIDDWTFELVAHN